MKTVIMSGKNGLSIKGTKVGTDPNDFAKGIPAGGKVRPFVIGRDAEPFIRLVIRAILEVTLGILVGARASTMQKMIMMKPMP